MTYTIKQNVINYDSFYISYILFSLSFVLFCFVRLYLRYRCHSKRNLSPKWNSFWNLKAIRKKCVIVNLLIHKIRSNRIHRMNRESVIPADLKRLREKLGGFTRLIVIVCVCCFFLLSSVFDHNLTIFKEEEINLKNS